MEFKPIFFEENRVYRVYLGGNLIGKLHGDIEEDSDHPEEWLASTVEAFDNSAVIETEGLSRVKNSKTTFKELIDKYPTEILGDKKWDVLVKYLDSAMRLPVQVHPTSAQSKQYFGGKNGKTEMWIILETRENAALYYGFKDKITQDEFTELVLRSQEERDLLPNTMNKVKVKEGDIYFIPANRVHAIGAGCLILELQEASDYTIQPEYYCGEQSLTDEQRFLGLDLKTALSLFNFNEFGTEVVELGKLEPKLISENPEFLKFSLNDYDITECFASNKYIIKKELTLENGPALYVVVKGNGILDFQNETTLIKRGDYFFIPAILKNKVKIIADNLELIECLPSKGA